jgi:6-phosphogluconolactonase
VIKLIIIHIFTFTLILLTTILIGQKRFLYAGSYSDKDSFGIYVFEFDERSGHLSDIIHKYKILNPSFLTISHNKNYLFATSENEEGSASGYKIDHKTGALQYINTQQSNGSGPCHVETDINDKWCIIGHYGSGNISVLPILADGNLGTSVQSIQHIQNNSVKSTVPRVHSINIASNNKDIFVPDLGLDKIQHYTLQSKNQPLKPAKNPHISLTKGSGPRHFAFHPDGKFAYCILEYTSKINVYKVQKTGLKDISNVSTLPKDFSGKNYCADIHISPDGRFVYGSNRGHNSIAIFAVNKTNGDLTLVGHQPTIGDFPRNFAIDPSGNFLLVANQKSDNIQIFKRDLKTGLLVHVQEVKNIHKPVCLKFL